MDVHVWFWDGDTVCRRYLGSQFLSRASLDDLKSKLVDTLHGLHLGSIVKIPMDGPNVNWRFYKDLQQQILHDYCVSLIGSCGLHQVHEAFQNGGRASGWGLDNFLSSCYWLFKDTPARQEDCSKCTGTTVFPMKFCKH